MIDISRTKGCRQLGSIIPVAFAALSVMFVSAVQPTVSAQEIEDCIESPNSAPPQGSHWYYRTDRVNQRKCWYLGPQGKKTQNIAAQQSANSRAPQEAETASFAAQVQTQQPVTQMGDATGGGTIQEGASAVRWPDPPHPIDVTARNAAASAPSFQEHSTIREQEIDTLERPLAPAPETPVTATAAAPTVAPLSVLLQVLLLVAGALALAGIFLRALLKVALLRRRKPFDDQGEADLPSCRDEPIPPKFASSFPRRPATREHFEMDDDFEELLRALRQRGRRAA